VKPALIVALAATAARSLPGKIVTISKMRGDILDLTDGARGLVTIHPGCCGWTMTIGSAEYCRFVADLRMARQAELGR